MCGIIGFSGRFDVAALNAGAEALHHRGPDDAGFFMDKASGIGLAHVRLSIIDPSPLGHQPMVSSDGVVTLVFNGEIYNFRELRAELESKGFTFRGHSDTEVLLNFYLAEGDAMLPRLNGIFAFALWDKSTRSLLVARDGFGVKPLYYAETPKGFTFASEIKGVLHLAPEMRELDAVALHRYLSFLWCPGDGTPLKFVKKLLPGEAMIIRDGRIQQRWSWYQLPVFRVTSPDMSELDALSGTAMHLRRAVNRQMVADVPVGAFLSGGLDSSAVVTFAREQNPDIHCFTIEPVGGHEDGVTDDLPYALRVARHLGVSLDVVKVDVKRIASDIELMVAQLDEPLADPAPLNVLYISQLAREQGIKVLLSGTGGDDLFTGYRRHRAVQVEPYWNWLPAVVRRALDDIFTRLDERKPFFRRLAKVFNGAALEGDARLANYFVWAREADLLSMYTAAFRAELHEARAIQPMLDFLSPLHESITSLDRMLALEQRFFLSDHNLTYTDKMSMAVGVEVRVPFLDIDLVEFVHRIPMRFKQRGRQGKWILKKAMESYLPHDVVYRPKTGFGAPLRRWMRNELRPLLLDLLSTESLKRRGLFEPAAVQRLIVRNELGQVDATYTLLSLLSIEIWCRTYIDNYPTSRPGKSVVEARK